MTYRYFHMSNGLRGCYMPDNSQVLKFKSRKELKNCIEWEARDLRDAGYAGASKKLVASFVAEAWRIAGRKAYGLPLALPLKPAHADSYCYGLFLSTATRAECREYEKEME